MAKTRLDVALVERGLAETRAAAQRMIMAGLVFSNDRRLDKAGQAISADLPLEVRGQPHPYVSRGGLKLEKALEHFAIPVEGRIALDVGASTGGFTDCLLQRGAGKVYAIDVGKGILHWKLRNDPRVVLMEETNARFVESLPEQISLVTVDASFISLRILLPVVKKWIELPPFMPREGGNGGLGQIIALIKPQFEAGKKDVSRGDGVIRDPEIHRQVLLDILGFAQGEGFGIRGLIKSPLLGPKGNAEFLVWLDQVESSEEIEDLSEIIERVLT